MRYRFKLSLSCSLEDDAAGPVPNGLPERIDRMVSTLAAARFAGDESLFLDMVVALEGVASVVRRANACGMVHPQVDDDDDQDETL